MLITSLSREVNEDNVLIRNILGEFEDSLKYVSKPAGLMDARSGLLSPVFSVNHLQHHQFSLHCQTSPDLSPSHSSDFYQPYYYCGLLGCDDSMHCQHAFSEVQADLIFLL